MKKWHWFQRTLLSKSAKLAKPSPAEADEPNASTFDGVYKIINDRWKRQFLAYIHLATSMMGIFTCNGRGGAGLGGGCFAFFGGSAGLGDSGRGGGPVFWPGLSDWLAEVGAWRMANGSLPKSSLFGYKKKQIDSVKCSQTWKSFKKCLRLVWPLLNSFYRQMDHWSNLQHLLRRMDHFWWSGIWFRQRNHRNRQNQNFVHCHRKRWQTWSDRNRRCYRHFHCWIYFLCHRTDHQQSPKMRRIKR